jgi:hypothetical protein
MKHSPGPGLGAAVQQSITHLIASLPEQSPKSNTQSPEQVLAQEQTQEKGVSFAGSGLLTVLFTIVSPNKTTVARRRNKFFIFKPLQGCIDLLAVA